jgi:hypothetical protein
MTRPGTQVRRTPAALGVRILGWAAATRPRDHQ